MSALNHTQKHVCFVYNQIFILGHQTAMENETAAEVTIFGCCDVGDQLTGKEVQQWHNSHVLLLLLVMLPLHCSLHHYNYTCNMPCKFVPYCILHICELFSRFYSKLKLLLLYVKNKRRVNCTLTVHRYFSSPQIF